MGLPPHSLLALPTIPCYMHFMTGGLVWFYQDQPKQDRASRSPDPLLLGSACFPSLEYSITPHLPSGENSPVSII